MDAEQRRRERLRQLAQALRSAQSPQGQMAGRFYVAPNPLQHIAALGQQFAGARLNKRLDEEDAQAEQAERQRLSEALARMTGTEDGPQASQGPQMQNASLTSAPPDPRRSAAMEVFQGMPLDAQRQIVGDRAMQAMFPTPPKLERVDLGDAIGVVDEQGQLMQLLPKGVTPDAKLGDERSRWLHQTPSGTAVLGADTTRRWQDLNAQTAAERLALDREKAAPDDKAAEKAAQVEQTWNMYETARAGLMQGLEGTETGPLAGRIPAVTAAQQTAEGGVAAMAPVLKQLFRVAGEGVFTDRDQALLLDMVPKRTDQPEARDAKMANIDRIVRAKLGLPPLEVESPQAPQDELRLSEGAMRYLYQP